MNCDVAGEVMPMTVDALKSAETPVVSTVHRPLGTHGLWGSKSDQLPAYIQNVSHALIRDGHDESSAIAMAVSAMKRWAAGGSHVTPEVQAAAGKALAEWESLRAKHGGGARKLLDVPDLIKVGPEGYIHGFICVRPPCGGHPGRIKASDLSVRKDGVVVHKPSGYGIGNVERHASGKGYVASHVTGGKIAGVKGSRADALASLARKHNSQAAQDAKSGEAKKPAAEAEKPAKPVARSGEDIANKLAASSNPAKNARDLSNAELDAADKELTYRAAALGQAGKLARHHKAVKSEMARRGGVADEDFAGPYHTFPIKDQKSVTSAATLAHHAEDPAAVKAKIREIAERKFPGMRLPPSLAVR